MNLSHYYNSPLSDKMLNEKISKIVFLKCIGNSDGTRITIDSNDSNEGQFKLDSNEVLCRFESRLDSDRHPDSNQVL